MTRYYKPHEFYDIWWFKFTCIHKCSEYKWDICKRCRSKKKCINHSRAVYPSEEGISNLTRDIEVSTKHIEDLGFYTHEFTEATLIQILRNMKKDWYASVKYKGYEHTYISHFITLWGANNGKCLDPVTKRNKPRW